MGQEEKRIVSLYVTSKLSEQQIATRLNVSSARIRWVIKKQKVRKRSISDAIRYLNITQYDKKPFVLKNKLNSSEKELKIAGIMLYWGEGTKERGKVVLHNSDPAMVSLFVRFLREICGIHESRLRLTLHLYPDHQKRKLTKFWSKVTGIPISQFHMPFVHPGTKGTYKKKSQYGTVAIVYSDSQLLKTINAWIDEYRIKFATVAQ